MIYAIKGKVFEKIDGKIALNTISGVIYEINVSLITLTSVEINEEKLFFITEIIKENEYTLYGFLDKDEKRLFESLIKINGIGPKVALGIISTLTPAEFIDVIKNQDINRLKKVPGIGPKSAKRILMEMSEFEMNSVNPVHSQVIIALENLGFKKADIIKVISGMNGSVEEIIKEALKKLGGRV